MSQLTNHQQKLVNLLTKEQYDIAAGADWPSFNDFKTLKNTPQFVFDELIPMYSNLGLGYIEFYITNVCNLSCSDCRSFNNFDFTGHYKFDSKLYSNWAEFLHLSSYVILGGEPLLHPDFKIWAYGLRKLWPDAWAKIDTNGTYITKVKNLHQILLDNRYFLCINIHNKDKMNELLEDIKIAFGECTEIKSDDSRIYYNNTPSVGHGVDGLWLITKDGVPIQIRPSWEFDVMPAGYTNWYSLLNGTADTKSIYMGDPKKSHNACSSRFCHIMLDGEIYKCATVATMSKFLKQKNIKWPHDTVHEYQPITLSNYTDTEIETLKQPISQCTFCPCESERVDISSTSYNKKNKITSILPI